MPFLRECTGKTLQWRRPHFFSTSYELRAGDQLLATVNRTGVLKQRAIAEAEGQQWTFQREGLMGRKSVIYPGASSAQASNEPVLALASIQPGWSGTGTLSFHDGRVYTWTRTGNWRPVWSWVGPGNKTLLSIKRGRLLEIAPAASDLPDLVLLSLFGLYLILMMESDEAASAAAIAGAASG
jgi:hypothetical protein